MRCSSLIKYCLALLLGLDLLSLGGCGRRGGLELPPGAQETREGNAALRAVIPQSTATNASVFPPAAQQAPTLHTSSTSSGSATPEAETGEATAAATATPAPNASTSAAGPPMAKRPFILDPLL